MTRPGEDYPQITVHGGDEVVPAMRQWAELDRRLDSPSLATSTEWTQAWLNHYGPIVTHRVFLGRRGDRVVGACLVTSRSEPDGPFQVRAVHLGTAGEPDLGGINVEYNDLLAEPEERRPFAVAICRQLSAERGWDRVCWDGFPAETLRELGAADSWRCRYETSNYFDLTQARQQSGEPLDLLRSKLRKRLRWSLNKFVGLRCDWAESLSAAQAVFHELIALHEDRWTRAGQTGVFAQKQFVQFHHEIIERLFPAGRVALVRVASDAGTVACLYLLRQRNRLLLYQMGWAPSSVPNVSPGLVANYAALVEAGRRGFDAYEFLVGDALYKRQLCTAQATLCWAQWRRPSWKFYVLDCARAWKRRWRKGAPSSYADTHTPALEAAAGDLAEH